MPLTPINYEVHDTPQGRRIYREEAETQMNNSLNELFNMVSAIPSGPQGVQGPAGPRGDMWIVGNTREYAEGLSCVLGNAVYRRFAAQGLTALFRCLQPTTITAANFPTSATSNSMWELILLAPYGERGAEGPRGLQGLQGPAGVSARVMTFSTDAAAQAHAIANPLDLVISTEGY